MTVTILWEIGNKPMDSQVISREFATGILWHGGCHTDSRKGLTMSEIHPKATDTVDAWWTGMSDAEIERETARRYAAADRLDHLPDAKGTTGDVDLVLSGDMSGNETVTDTLTADDRNEHAHYVKALVASVREALGKVDAINAKRGTPAQQAKGVFASDHVGMFDAIMSGNVDWNPKTHRPVFPMLGKALGCAKQRATQRYDAFVKATHLAPDVWGALFAVKAERAK